MAVIGFVPAFYDVSEDAGSVEVIVKLRSGNLSSPITLTLTTQDGSAGGAYIVVVFQYHHTLTPIYLHKILANNSFN